MRKLISSLFVFILGSCSNQTVDLSKFDWLIKINDYEELEVLDSSIQITQYNGTVVDQKITNENESNGVFLLLDLTITKQVVGSNSFTWDQLYLEDKEQNKYYRLQDSFIEQHDYSRIPQIDLKIGSYDGWIAFSVPKNSQLTLVYNSENGQYVQDIK